MDIDLSEYKEIFVNESREHLQVLNQSLLDLEKDPKNTDLLNNIFRSAHTLKGSSATMGYETVSKLAHKMENILDLMRNGKITVTSEVLDTIFDCFDALEALIGEIEDDKESEIDILHLVEKLNGLSSTEPTVTSKKQKKVNELRLSTAETKKVQDAIDEGLNILKMDVTLDEECAVKSVRMVVFLNELKKHATILASAPDFQKLEKGDFDLQFSVVISTQEDIGTIKNTVEKINEISGVEISLFSVEQGKESKKDETESEKEIKVDQQVTKGIQSVRINIERLDSLMNLVGELVINKIRLLDIKTTHGFKDNELDETVSTIDRLTTDLRDEIMQIRMLPVENVFNRFPRMIRDLSKKREKEINFVVSGGEIELDRTILDEIGELLVHLLRNCVDHGIEHPEERKRLGKDEKGTIELIAMREKDHVIIEVNDDGYGIDAKEIKNKVIEKDLLAEADLDKLTEEELQNLIFLPGVSTSIEVTDTSGRGVGLDAVKTKIEALGGVVRLNSTLGEGTKIMLQLPLTMAIIQAMLVTIGSQTFAIPISNISEIVTVSKSNIREIGNNGITTLRGNVLPLKKLHEMMGLEVMDKDELTVVVIDRGTESMGFIVDSVVSQQEVVIKSLDNILNTTKGFAGATILGDGRVILILDVASFT